MGTRQRRQRETANRRKDILAAAMKVFWKRGYSRTTMPQIAEAAELAPGTLYLYFPSKDALYTELLLEGYQRLLERLAARVARGGDLRHQVMGLIDVFFDFAREYPEYYDILFFVLQQERSGGWQANFPPQQIQRLAAGEDACKAVAASVLGKLPHPPHGNHSAIVDAVWSMLSGVVFHFGSQDRYDAVSKQAKELILKAIFGK
jgi:AcrR family transcriptional regulator